MCKIKMSLLSSNVATVNSSEYVVPTQSLQLPQNSTRFLGLKNAAYKQALGYVAVRGQKWTPVMDLKTGEPLQLPQGYLPVGFYFKAVQDVPNTANLTFYTIDSLVDPDTANFVAIISLFGTLELNPGFYMRVDPNTSGEDYENRNYVIVRNTNYPAPVASGVLQVVVTYF